MHIHLISDECAGTHWHCQSLQHQPSVSRLLSILYVLYHMCACLLVCMATSKTYSSRVGLAASDAMPHMPPWKCSRPGCVTHAGL